MAKHAVAAKKSTKSTDPRDTNAAATEQQAIGRTGPADQTPPPDEGFSLSKLDPLDQHFIGRDIPIVGGVIGSGLDLVNDLLGRHAADPNSVTRAEWDAAREATKNQYDAAGHRISDYLDMALSDHERAAGGPGTTPIRDVTPITAKDLGYHDVNAPGPATVYDPGQVERYRAPIIGAPTKVEMGPIGAAREVQAAEIGPAAQAGPVRVGTTTINTGQSDADRAAQMGNLDQLERLASGQGPSVAENELKAALADVGQQQMGLAASARGSERAGARRGAIQAIGEKGFQAAKAGAAARAGEVLSARQQLTGALSDVRGADTALATEQARLTQQAQALQAQIDQALASGNRDAYNALKAQQAQLIQQARTVSAQMANQRQEFVTATGASIDEGNAARELQRNLTQAGLDTSAAAAGTAAANERAGHMADTRTKVGEDDLDRGLNVATGNANRDSNTDVEGGRQQIQVGQINNEQGVNRDVAEGNRKTQDFNATTGALNSATGQVGNAAQLTLAQVKAMTDADLQQLVARGNAAAAAELARRQAQSGAAALGEKVIGAAGGKPPIPGGG